MKKILFLFIFTLASATLWSQNVQWSFHLLEYSSQRSTKEYAARQVLGIPNAFPAGVDNIHAWEPKGHAGEEYIKVGFLNPVKPKQIIIAESFHPGYISKVLAYDADGNEHEVATYTPRATGEGSRFLHIKTGGLNIYIIAVKIFLKCEKGIPVGIDAIGISTSDKPFTVKPNPNDIIKSSMVAIKLDSNVNSIYPEIGPLVSPDGKTLYFSRSDDPADVGGKKDMEDIWYSEWDAATKHWRLAKNIGTPLNNKDPNFINSISPDGNSILLGNSYLPDGSMNGGVSISKRTSTGWSAPERLRFEDGDDSNIGDMADYYESNSQKILMISNNRKGDSFGDRDVYVSFLKDDSIWTKPLNLGGNINTKGTEAAPFLASDDKTLYYTSNGLGGYGGSDIYMTRRLDETWTKWSDPENMGPVVNTSFDESYLTIDAAGNRIYFTSEVTSENDVDIYMLELPQILKPSPVMLITGRVINSKTNEFVPGARIFFENLATGEEVGIASSNPVSGTFQIILPSGINYGYLAQKQGFVSVHSNIDLTGLKAYKEYHQDIFITPIEVGQTVVINNVFFDSNKYILKKESFPELNRLAGLLRKNDLLKIEISANTDSKGTMEYNDKLSIKRAQSVADYLIAGSGADKSRVAMKHYGELNPVASNTTARGRQLNRRVQFKILAK